MKRSELFFSTLLVPLDFLAVFAAFVLSYYLRDQYGFLPIQGFSEWAAQFQYSPALEITLPFEQYVGYLLVIVPSIIIIFALLGLYRMRSSLSWPRRLLHIFVGVSVGEGFVLLLFLLKKDFFMPRSTVLYSWILATVLVLLGRLVVRTVQRWLHRYSIGIIRTAVIGKSEAAKAIITQLTSYSGTAYRLCAHIRSANVATVLKELEQLELDELIVVNEHYANEDLIVLRNHCLEQRISFSFVPSLLTELPSSFTVRNIVRLPVIEVRPTPLDEWGRVIKRIFDIIFSCIFIILLSPVFVLIGVVLAVFSPGPLIYRHKRIGKNRKSIYVWKFRSMDWKYCTGVGNNGDAAFQELLDAHPDLAKEWRETHKLKNDPRVSWPGRILRTTSLDELPQLFNALFGTLSLVGPRPIVEDEVEKYGEKARILFTVKPGVTGLWQVSGRTDTSYEERIRLDAYYIEHWNLFSDCIILIKTAWAILTKRGGAY